MMMMMIILYRRLQKVFQTVMFLSLYGQHLPLQLVTEETVHCIGFVGQFMLDLSLSREARSTAGEFLLLGT